jgi:arylsulfatase A-like enzyme
MKHTMDQRSFMKTIATGFAALGAILGLYAQSAAAERPNIVFILADDHASEAISAYGSWLKDFAKTPNIDRIAREGMLFRNVFVSNSICSPSRASILTGQYSHKNGVFKLSESINEGCPLFPVELRKAGYATYVVGKWHLKSMPEGFDDFRVTVNQGRYNDPVMSAPGGEKVNYQGYASDVYTDLALDWLRSRPKDRPFLLAVHHKACHAQWEYPDRWADMLVGQQVPEPPTLHEDIAASGSALKQAYAEYAHMTIGKRNFFEKYRESIDSMKESKDILPYDPDVEHDRSRAAYQNLIKRYLRCAAAMDENVGRLLDYLDQEGLTQNTLVIYSADQGYWLGQHGFYDKRLIFEESLRMPFLAKLPGVIAPGSTDEHMCCNVDFAPTFLDFAGVPVPAAMQGRSLKPLLQGRSPADWRKATFYAYYISPRYSSTAHYGVRTERYKLLHNAGGPREFYDLQTDPREMVNQINSPQYADAIGECEKELQRLIREVDISQDKMPLPAPSMEERRKANQEKPRTASEEGPKRGREKRRTRRSERLPLRKGVAEEQKTSDLP